MIFLKRYKRYIVEYNDKDTTGYITGYTTGYITEHTAVLLIYCIKYGCKNTVYDDSNFSISGSWDTIEHKTHLRFHNYTYELIDMYSFHYSNDGVHKTQFKRLMLKIYDIRTLEDWNDVNFYDRYWDVFEHRRIVGILRYIIKHEQVIAPVEGPVKKSDTMCFHKICDCD